MSKAELVEPVIDMAEFGRRIAARKAELGLPDPPRNAGKHRTASKRALLKATPRQARGGRGGGGSGDTFPSPRRGEVAKLAPQGA